MFARLILFLILLVLFGLAPFTAKASETRPVANAYTITVGFDREPAIQGDTNGIRVHVLKGKDPVSGLEKSLRATVAFADEVRELPLSPTDQPGVYVSTFIPLQPGPYAFHLTGTIESAQIDETFSSGNGIPNVDLRSTYEFPTTAHGFAGHAAVPIGVGAVMFAFGVWTTRLARRRG